MHDERNHQLRGLQSIAALCAQQPALRRLAVWLVIIGLCAGAGPLPRRQTHAQFAVPLNCSVSYQLVRTLSNGAKWEMCWEPRIGYGYRLWQVTFTPAGGVRRHILNALHVAQLFVAYDDGGPRFHDISFGRSLIPLTSAECPTGTLLTGATLCAMQQTRLLVARGASSDQSLHGESLILTGYINVGVYYYIMQYTFNEDGSIEPSLGASGALQRYGGTDLTGWPVSNQIAVNHNHMAIWRMDFDLDDAANDRAEQFDVAADDSGKPVLGITPLGMEHKADNQLDRLRFWRVRDTQRTNTDGHSISYEIEPWVTDEYRASEAFTHDDFYLTQFNPNETLVDDGNGIASFVNGETISDAVLWYSVNFHHVPRDEETARMPVHWQGFVIRPRDLQSKVTGPDNSIPTPTANPTQTVLPVRTATPTPSQPPSATVSATPIATATAPQAATVTPLPSPAPTAMPSSTAIALAGCDAYEANNTIAEARPIRIGELQKHVLCVNGDADYAHLTLAANQSVIIETLQLKDKADTKLQLYDSRGTQLAYDDNGGGGKKDSRIIFRAAVGGSYYVRVSQRDGKGSPKYAYTLRVY